VGTYGGETETAMGSGARICITYSPQSVVPEKPSPFFQA
jgi:hypothetical protein